MVRTKPWMIVPLLAIVGMLASCAPSPSCTVADLVAPIPSGPIPGSIINDLSTPILWSYGAGYECQPSGFQLQLASDMNFNDILVTDSTGAFDTSWDPPSPYDPLSEYWWRVAGVMDDGGGGIDLGPWSVPVRFFTGPVCDPAHQTNPELIWPANGETIDTVMPLLAWEYPGLLSPGCTPEGYRIDLSTEPAFADTSLSGGTGNPEREWFPGEDLQDCETYYWRVAPIVDVALGPFSETRSFYVDVSGACGAGISGLVWHDECGLPELGPFPISPPPGCIDDGMGYFIADGVVDPGEGGIPGVVIDLGSGACPSTGLTTAETGPDGSYSFPGLADGTYCVTLDLESHDNVSDLIPGGFSYPATEGSLASHQVSVAGGMVLDVDFGWDFQFSPGYAGGSISGVVWHDLCAVPWGPAPPVPPAGCVDTGGGGLAANGVYEAGERGIEGVTVHLGEAPCPSTSIWTAITGPDGEYSIPGLVDGSYCLWVDALADGNDAILIPGGWTYPESEVNPASQEVAVTAPNESSEVNFGWDYQFLPLPPGSAKAKENANCRYAPLMQSEALWFLPKGEYAAAEARDETGKWLWIRRNDGRGFCWMLLDLLEFDFNPLELPIRGSPVSPPPTPTPCPAGRPCK